MNTSISHQDIAGRLAAQSDVVGRLAKDAGAFAAVFAAFEARDPDAFRWVLQRVDMLAHCELICEWVRIKLGVLRCAEVCGPYVQEPELPNPREFAQAIVRLAADERLLRRVVDAVSCGHAEDYREAIAELKLERFCHLICRWVYSVIYDRVCEAVCTPVRVFRPDPVGDIRAAGHALSRVVDNEKLFAVIERSAISFNCEILQTAIDEARFGRHCEIICRLICAWRCAWVCFVLCERAPPILRGVDAVEEARQFALTAAQLAGQPRALGDLVAAIERREAGLYGEIAHRFGLFPYCAQLCAWVCSVTCAEFCFCVCRPQELIAWFTSIGGYQFESQIDSALPGTGLTAGGTKAFFSTLRLNGVMTQTLGGAPLEYRFECQPVTRAATTLATAISAAATTLSVTSGAGFPAAGPFNVVIGGTGGGYEIMTVVSVSGTTWTVVRGRQATTAAPASAGAKIVTGVAASAGWTPVAPGQIARTVIGTWEHFVGGMNPVETKVFTVNGVPGPDELVATFTPDGWIQVPQMNDVYSASGAFAANGNMIELISSSLSPFPAADETGVSAGNPANHPLPADLYFGVRMRVRQQGSVSESDGGTCAVLAIDNTLYNNVDHHPEWAGGIASGQYGVCMLDIEELQAAGCAGITDSLTVLFTASHPNLGGVGLSMIGPGGPYGFGLPPIAETGNWYGAATNNFNLADLTPCAYLVTLSVSLLLTTGDSDFPGPLIDQFAFCLA